MESQKTDAGQVFCSKLLNGVPGIIHGFGVRGIGVAEYLDALEIKDRFLVDTDQIHGNSVHYLMWPARNTSFVSRSEVGVPKKGPGLEGDAFITDRPGIVCLVRSADCVPIIIADTKQPAIAAVHAGWRGTSKDVVGRALCAMRETFGTKPRDCVAAIGPRICGECYEVGDEVIDSLHKLNIGNEWRLKDHHIDLGLINKLLLEKAGVIESNIDISDECTFCNPAFASYRRDKNDDERQFSFIMLK